jgi:phage-related protein
MACLNSVSKVPKELPGVFYGTLVGRRIVMLHSFVKKSQKTPRRELDIAERRLKEVKDGHA